jgi:nucleoside-diphosphate-sugar epimerase
MKILITGGSGYIGGILVDVFISRPDVEKVLVVDKDPLPESLKSHIHKDKIEFFQGNLADDRWQEPAGNFLPDIVIHTAWQIRTMYGKLETQHDWNVGGSDDVFDFSFNFPSVKKLIHFSTVASYGAYPSNTTDHFFTEQHSFRITDYAYAEEKRVVEEILKEKYDTAKKEGKRVPEVVVIRPASVTGPHAFKVKKGVSLQSALAGKVLSFVPVTPKWLRQFVHEQDIAGIVEFFAFNKNKNAYEVINACPPGEVVLGKDMAKAVGKKALVLQPWMVRIAFFFAWHLTRGKIPTSKGGWKSYSYPIAVDGTKVTKLYNYQYKFSPLEAFLDARK